MNLPNYFQVYLQNQDISSVTVKNYLSDLNHFLNWLHQVTGINHNIAGKSIFGLFTQETLKEYQAYLTQQNIPITTINRRFSTLRKVGRFAQFEGWVKDNPAEKIRNLTEVANNKSEQILNEFRHHLEKEKISSVTIKNYLSDLRHFLNWLEFVG